VTSKLTDGAINLEVGLPQDAMLYCKQHEDIVSAGRDHLAQGYQAGD